MKQAVLSNHKHSEAKERKPKTNQKLFHDQ